MATQPPISIRFKENVRDQLDQFAGLTKRSRNYIVNEAVEAYTNDQLQRIAEIDAAVEEAKTGTGYSKEAVMTWLRSKGTKQALSKPDPDVLPE